MGVGRIFPGEKGFSREGGKVMKFHFTHETKKTTLNRKMSNFKTQGGAKISVLQ